MAIERQLQEAVARCVAIMVYHQSASHGNGGTSQVVAEIAAVADWVRQLESSHGQPEQQILADMKRELVDRYGPERATRLHSLVVRGFSGSGQSRRQSDHVRQA